MAIKDEVFVAYQLTSPKKYARDRERFRVDPVRGDRIDYVHLNRPAFDVLGRHFEWDMETRDWQLRLMRGPASCAGCCRVAPARAALPRLVRGRGLGAVCDGRLVGAAAEEAPAPAGGRHRLPEVRYPKEDAAHAASPSCSGRPREGDRGRAVGSFERVVHAVDEGERAARDRGRPLDGARTGRGRHPLPALPERGLSATLDALRLAEGMTLKAAAAGLPWGAARP